jgi:CRISPR-associated exonuclease Cas4
LLVWREFGVRPDFGILQYEDRSFEIPFDADLEYDLLDLLAAMREDMFDDDLPRDHDDWRRCRRCGVRDFCDDRLE